MHPVFRELFPSECFCLCNFILVVREEIVYAAHMDVDLISEIVMVTSTTLDMPTRTTFDFYFSGVYIEFDFPEIRSITLRIICFPESKVGNLLLIVLVIVYTDA